ncbi:hypothetical protein LPJ53_001248 [Coemansia erecta]|uniref:Uncharacterized protein n=1 Tax=Coemansia erecta TaxID=147472 RepID=A0A9W7Y5S6_9FUNG|nr:hypothetical protein LPJ53_001248 [Coemansia erecta]
MARQQLNTDIKERISYAARKHSISRSSPCEGSSPPAEQFAQLAFTLTHVDRAWRHVALKHAWHTVHLTTPALDPLIPSLLHAHGARHTRRLIVKVHFKSILSHYRRYTQTHEESECQPFGSLGEWRALRVLEVEYMHKCAFPGLAAYLEPRMQGVSRLVVRGRVPVDMRRAVVFLQADGLRCVEIEGQPAVDDSLSTVSSHGDALLARRLGASITSLRLSTLVDIRIVRAILGNTSDARMQLCELKLHAFGPAQLTAIELSRAARDIHVSKPRVWHSLHTLSLHISLASDDDIPAVSLDADEFPQLVRLCIRPAEPEYMQDDLVRGRMAYAQTFAKPWRALEHVRLGWAGAADIRDVGGAVAGLLSLRVDILGGPIGGSAVCSLLADLPLLQSLVLGGRSGADGAVAECRARNIRAAETGDGYAGLAQPSADSLALRVLHVDSVLGDAQVVQIAALCPRLREISYVASSDKETDNVSGRCGWGANMPSLSAALGGWTSAIPW